MIDLTIEFFKQILIMDLKNDSVWKTKNFLKRSTICSNPILRPGSSVSMNISWSLPTICALFYDQKRSETVIKRPGTVDGLKRLQNHVHDSRFKNERHTVVNFFRNKIWIHFWIKIIKLKIFWKIFKINFTVSVSCDSETWPWPLRP
jgi:hypothetical protein